MEYYFADEKNVNKEKNEIIISGFEFKHLVKVLRKKAGDEITLTDGRLNVYRCKIENVYRNELHCKIIDAARELFEPEVSINLFLSPLRNMSRFEFAVEKAVELGVKQIQPVLTKYTIQKNDFSLAKAERLKKIILSAMCQSQRCHLPEFKNAVTISELTELTKNDKCKIVMYEFSSSNESVDSVYIYKEVDLLIGPEGGFSEDEIELLKNYGWITQSLGKRKLRAETAAAVSVFKLTGIL